MDEACLTILREAFQMDAFRPGQREAAEALLAGRDLMCILPTGAGKSLCFQLPALAMTGVTLVISPLIALMRDQVRRLTERRIPAVSLDSLMSREEQQKAMELIRQGKAKLVYASPERLLSSGFRGWWTEHPPAMIVVDEAHCVARWGGDFRPAYDEIGSFAASLPARPVLCAMTATADPGLRRDIIRRLGMRRVRCITMPIVRENLHYELITTLERDRCVTAKAMESRGKCVVFCTTRRRTEELSRLINACFANEGMDRKAAFYHAGLERQERLRIQERFLAEEIQVLTATSAFGMGVDVPDIRCVIHDGLPDSLIDYAQQTGRAGRDHADARCIMIFDPLDLETRRRSLHRIRNDHGLSSMRRWRRLRKAWRETRQVLRWCLGGGCLSAGLVHAMGQRTAPCGNCSACLGKQAGTAVIKPDAIPALDSMEDWQLRAWVLRWERDAFARREHLPKRKILSNQQVIRAAKSGVLPRESMDDEQAWKKLRDVLDHMLRRRNNYQD